MGAHKGAFAALDTQVIFPDGDADGDVCVFPTWVVPVG